MLYLPLRIFLPVVLAITVCAAGGGFAIGYRSGTKTTVAFQERLDVLVDSLDITLSRAGLLTPQLEELRGSISAMYPVRLSWASILAPRPDSSQLNSP